MLMKVHNKGQVVIPSRIRHLLHIEIGDMVDVDILAEGKKLKISPVKKKKLGALAGILSRYKRNHPAFPTSGETHEALAKGLLNER